MTREHKILQQFKERQQIGPRLSLQHNTTSSPSTTHVFKKADSGVDLNRPRSNALITEDSGSQYSPLVVSTGPSRMKNSPSASDIHGYYSNLPQGGLDGSNEYKRKANSLSTAVSPSRGDNIYYNKDAIELQLKMAARNTADSDSDSDDFIDINRLRDDSVNNTYYNLRDHPMVMKSKAKRHSDIDRPVYENYSPQFRRESTQ